MTSLFVYADFDWLDISALVGELSFGSVRGNETYSFLYDKEWLAKYGDVFLSEDLQNFPGVQYTRPERDIFSSFSDALPDRWGRTLLNRREQIAAAKFMHNTVTNSLHKIKRVLYLIDTAEDISLRTSPSGSTYLQD